MSAAEKAGLTGSGRAFIWASRTELVNGTAVGFSVLQQQGGIFSFHVKMCPPGVWSREGSSLAYLGCPGGAVTTELVQRYPPHLGCVSDPDQKSINSFPDGYGPSPPCNAWLQSKSYSRCSTLGQAPCPKLGASLWAEGRNQMRKRDT